MKHSPRTSFFLPPSTSVIIMANDSKHDDDWRFHMASEVIRPGFFMAFARPSDTSVIGKRGVIPPSADVRDHPIWIYRAGCIEFDTRYMHAFEGLGGTPGTTYRWKQVVEEDAEARAKVMNTMIDKMVENLKDANFLTGLLAPEIQQNEMRLLATKEVQVEMAKAAAAMHAAAAATAASSGDKKAATAAAAPTPIAGMPNLTEAVARLPLPMRNDGPLIFPMPKGITKMVWQMVEDPESGKRLNRFDESKQEFSTSCEITMPCCDTQLINVDGMVTWQIKDPLLALTTLRASLTPTTAGVRAQFDSLWDVMSSVVTEAIKLIGQDFKTYEDALRLPIGEMQAKINEALRSTVVKMGVEICFVLSRPVELRTDCIRDAKDGKWRLMTKDEVGGRTPVPDHHARDHLARLQRLDIERTVKLERETDMVKKREEEEKKFQLAELERNNRERAIEMAAKARETELREAKEKRDKDEHAHRVALEANTDEVRVKERALEKEKDAAKKHADVDAIQAAWKKEQDAIAAKKAHDEKLLEQERKAREAKQNNELEAATAAAVQADEDAKRAKTQRDEDLKRHRTQMELERKQALDAEREQIKLREASAKRIRDENEAAEKKILADQEKLAKTERELKELDAAAKRLQAEKQLAAMRAEADKLQAELDAEKIRRDGANAALKKAAEEEVEQAGIKARNAAEAEKKRIEHEHAIAQKQNELKRAQETLEAERKLAEANLAIQLAKAKVEDEAAERKRVSKQAEEKQKSESDNRALVEHASVMASVLEKFKEHHIESDSLQTIVRMMIHTMSGGGALPKEYVELEKERIKQEAEVAKANAAAAVARLTANAQPPAPVGGNR
jgi:hypothetical protein